MHPMVTARPDTACSVTTPSKFSSAPSECHCQSSKGLMKCLQMTKSWGIKCRRPKDKFSNDLPDSNHQEPTPLPWAIEEFNIDISQPKMIGHADASCGSELRKRKSITGCVFTFSGGTMACESKTQTITASGSAEAEFVAAFTAAGAAQHPRFVLQELGFPQQGLTEIHINNQAALQIIDGNQAPTIRTRHLDARFFGPQDWQEEGSISVVHIAGILNP